MLVFKLIHDSKVDSSNLVPVNKAIKSLSLWVIQLFITLCMY